MTHAAPATSRWLLPVAVTSFGACLALLGASTWAPARLVVDSPLFPTLFYVSIAASVLLMAAQAVARPHVRLPWVLFATGACMWLLGDVVWQLWISHLDPQPFPSVADAGYLLMFPFTYAGLVILARRTVGRAPMALWLDGLIGGLGLSALAASFVLAPVLEIASGDVALVLTNLAYPVGDLVLLAVIVTAIAVLRTQAGPHWWLLLAGFTALTGADVRYLLELADGSHVHPSFTDLGWALGFLLVALAAQVPTSRPRRAVGSGIVGSALPLVSSAIAIAVLLDPDRHWASVAATLAVATIGLTLLRLALTIRETERLGDSHRLARTDVLTGLPNRRAFYDQAERLRDVAQASEGQAAVLLLDLDRFKEVNDSLGHLMGDELLCQVGPRLAAALPGGVVLARLGGDEFGVVLTGTEGVAPEEVARRLCAGLEEPFDLDGVRVQAGVSVGIALAPQHGDAATVLFQRADVAMYAAKRARSGWSTYVAAEDPNSPDRLRDLELLRAMLRGDGRGLVVHYQPKVRLVDGSLAGVEALVRWQHPARGLLGPGEFLGLVDENGLAGLLTLHVLDRALAQHASWSARGLHVPVAVNLSATTVIDADLPRTVEDRLAEHRTAPDALELEITEEFLMGDWVRARAVLTELRELGVRISVDDFGTGYSSLSYLRDLPIDQLKLDRTFVSRMERDATAAALVRSTVSLAHSLGLEMVAEGVETPGVLADLREFGCDQAQGFHLGRPMEPGQLEDWAARTLALSDSGVSAMNPLSASQA